MTHTLQKRHFKQRLSKRFSKLPLATAIALASQMAMAADTAPTADLGTLTVNVDGRQGTKVQTNVVTTQKKSESTTTGLRELLSGEPAISFTGGNGASQFINIRGMGQNSIDVKIDNAYNDSQILYHQGRHQLDPSLVKIVAVQKGAGSASAGIGQTNGAIIAKTVDALDLLREGQDFGFRVGAGYSSNDEISYNGTVYGRTGAFDFLLAGNKIDQEDYKPGDGYKAPKGGDKVLYSAMDKISYLAKVGATFGDNRLVLSHMNETDKGVRNIREEFDSLIQPSGADRQDPHYRELSLTQTNLEWTSKHLGFVDELTANAYVMENKRESEGFEQYGNPGVQGLTLGWNETKVETKGANINFDSRVHPNVLLKYGANYRHQEITPNYSRKATDIVNGRPFGIDLVNQEKTDTGVYVEAIADIGNVTATAGLRYDHFNFKAMDGKEVSNHDLNPSVGLIWQATPTFSLSASHNHATRSPRLVDALRSGNSNVSIADGTKAEKAKNTEVGFNYNNGNFTFNGSYFWQEIDGLLSRGQVARHDNGITSYFDGIDNVGYAKNRGWELGASYRYHGLTARVGVADSDPKFYSEADATGRPIAFSNKEFASRIGRTWTAGLAYRFAEPNIEIGVNHRLVEDVVGASAWMNDTAANLNMKRDGYNVTDIYANWKPYGNDRMNVNFSVNNVSDEFYIPHVTSSERGTPAAGREYRVAVNYKF